MVSIFDLNFSGTRVQQRGHLLGEQWLPASYVTIRRVTSIVNNPSTLRGWLAAWRHLHVMASLPWLGDGDLFLRAVRIGLVKHMGPAPMRKRMRASRLLALLQHFINHDLMLEATAAALAYIFALRIPSELLAQAEGQRFVLKRANRIEYGPIRRKGQWKSTTLSRWCTCATTPLLCARFWIAYLHECRNTGLCFNFAASTLMRRLATALQATGVPQQELSHWTSHCFRRGSGIDVLNKSGVAEMLKHGQWSSPRAAEPYASRQEQEAALLATAAWVIDASDDDV